MDKVADATPQDFETALITYSERKLNEDGTLSISNAAATIRVNLSAEDAELKFSHCVIFESAPPNALIVAFSQLRRNGYR